MSHILSSSLDCLYRRWIAPYDVLQGALPIPLTKTEKGGRGRHCCICGSTGPSALERPRHTPPFPVAPVATCAPSGWRSKHYLSVGGGSAFTPHRICYLSTFLPAAGLRRGAGGGGGGEKWGTRDPISCARAQSNLCGKLRERKKKGTVCSVGVFVRGRVTPVARRNGQMMTTRCLVPPMNCPCGLRLICDPVHVNLLRHQASIPKAGSHTL